jgi:3-oxoacyl-[acyl-carrier-protein] synthase-3
MSLHSVIIGTGSFLPEKILTNQDLATKVDTSDEWIFTRTGIRQRHIATEGELTSHLAIKAAEKAIAEAGIDKSIIDAVIVATTTPDQIFPSVATKVQAGLGLKQGAAFDVQAVCAGFIHALTTADSLIKNNIARTVLVIGADTLSKIVDWNDRATCILFGDGAGAVILQAQEGERGILGNALSADGTTGDILFANPTIQMQGKEVFKLAVQAMTDITRKALESANVGAENIDWVIPHLANQRILEATIDRIGLPKEKLISTVGHHANTSAASIPLALDEAVRAGKIKQGQLLALTAIGGGMAWGATIVRW